MTRNYLSGLQSIGYALREAVFAKDRRTHSDVLMQSALSRLTDLDDPIDAEADLVRRDLLNHVVYCVANHVPLGTGRSGGFRRSTVAIAQRGTFAIPRALAQNAASGNPLNCSLSFFGERRGAFDETQARDGWHVVWADYGRITTDGEAAGRHTWNQFLLTATARPLIIGVDWSRQAAPPTHYAPITPGLLAALGLPDDPASAGWRDSLLQQTSPTLATADARPELRELASRWASMSPRNGLQPMPGCVGWALFHLLRSFAIWGGTSFLSIPIPMGGSDQGAVSVLSVCSTGPLSESKTAWWRAVARDIFQPIIIRETEALARQEAESQVYVQSVDSVGHTLKNRAMSFDLAIGTAGLPRQTSVRKQAAALGDIGALLNFQAHMCRPGEPAKLQTVDSGLVTSETLPLSVILADLEPVTPTEPSRMNAELVIDAASRAVLTSLAIEPFAGHRRLRHLVRPLDAFYRELFYELFTNAANRAVLEARPDGLPGAPRLHVVHGDKPDELVLRNRFQLPKRPSERFEMLREGEWTHGLDCRGGGIYFNAAALGMAGVGSVDIRWSRTSDHAGEFEIKLWLRGMRVIV